MKMEDKTLHSGVEHEPFDKHQTISGYLATALDIEEKISGGIYNDYMKRNNWPSDLDDDAFEKIRKYLTILIKNTQKHKRILVWLAKEYDRD